MKWISTDVIVPWKPVTIFPGDYYAVHCQHSSCCHSIPEHWGHLVHIATIQESLQLLYLVETGQSGTFSHDENCSMLWSRFPLCLCVWIHTDTLIFFFLAQNLWGWWWQADVRKLLVDESPYRISFYIYFLWFKIKHS